MFAEAAASNGHLDVLQWLAAKCMLAPNGFSNTLEAAVAGGHITSAKFLFEHADQHGFELADNIRLEILESACEAGHLDVVTYLLDERAFRSLSPLTCVRQAVLSGNLALVEWLDAQGLCDFQSLNVQRVIEKGHADIMRWLFEHNPTTTRNWYGHRVADVITHVGFAMAQALYAFQPEVFDSDVVQLQLRGAAEAGDLAFVHWLLALKAPNLQLDSHTAYSVIASAAEHGHLDIVQFLFTTFRDVARKDWEWIEGAVSRVAGNDHVEIAKWLHANHMTDTATKQLMYNPVKYKLTHAAANGRLELIQWMVANAPHSKETNAADPLNQAAASGSLATLAWLHRYFRYKPRWNNKIIGTAVKHNHVHIVQWLHEQGYRGWNAALMNIATSLEMIAWLHNNRPERCTVEAMDRAAERGDFDSLLFLHKHRSEGCTADAAALAQLNNHPLVVEWLFETYPSIMTRDSVQDAMDQTSQYQLQYQTSIDSVLFWAP